MEKKIGVGVLVISLAAGATTDMQILPAHDFRAEDGRPFEVDKWKINETIANRLIAKLSTKKNKQLIDYEHQSLRSSTNGKEVIAAGWYTKMEWRPGSGMWLTDVALTRKAKEHVNEGELLYTSPVFLYDTDTGEITEIITVALTNTPAVDGMQEIAALTANYINKSEPTGEGLMTPAEIAALTTELSTLKTANAALASERDTANGKVTALTTDLAAANKKLTDIEAANAAEKAANEITKRDELIATALNDGRLVPKLKDWAATQSLAALNAYLESAPVIIGDTLQHEKDKGDQGTGEHGLTKEDLAMCSSQHIDPKVFAEQKQKLSAK